MVKTSSYRSNLTSFLAMMFLLPNYIYNKKNQEVKKNAFRWRIPSVSGSLTQLSNSHICNQNFAASVGRIIHTSCLVRGTWRLMARGIKTRGAVEDEVCVG